MKIITGNRGSGKTTRLITWAKEDANRVIIVPTLYQAQIIQREHPELRGRVFEVSNAQYQLTGRRSPQVAIDDIEDFIYLALGSYHSVPLVTSSAPVETLPPQGKNGTVTQIDPVLRFPLVGTLTHVSHNLATNTLIFRYYEASTATFKEKEVTIPEGYEMDGDEIEFKQLTVTVNLKKKTPA